MTKLSRIPRLLLLPALCLAACTADEPATLNADGQALVIEDLRIAGSNTRADAQPIEGSFVEGSRLQATITYDEQSSTGQYTYDNNNVWTSPAPAYWLTGGEQSVTLRTPYPDPGPMPTAFTATNWHEYDILEYSGQTAPTTSFILSHIRAQLCVTLKAGTGLTDADLARAEVTIKDSSTQLWHTNGAHYALLDPATSLPALTITLDGETYIHPRNIHHPHRRPMPDAGPQSQQGTGKRPGRHQHGLAGADGHGHRRHKRDHTALRHAGDALHNQQPRQPLRPGVCDGHYQQHRPQCPEGQARERHPPLHRG